MFNILHFLGVEGGCCITPHFISSKKHILCKVNSSLACFGFTFIQSKDFVNFFLWGEGCLGLHWSVAGGGNSLRIFPLLLLWQTNPLLGWSGMLWFTSIVLWCSVGLLRLFTCSLWLGELLMMLDRGKGRSIILWLLER